MAGRFGQRRNVPKCEILIPVRFKSVRKSLYPFIKGGRRDFERPLVKGRIATDFELTLLWPGCGSLNVSCGQYFAHGMEDCQVATLFSAVFLGNPSMRKDRFFLY